MNDIETFIHKIPDFNNLSSSEKIKYFAYFLLEHDNQSIVMAKQIGQCFEILSLKPYSNIPNYLSEKSKGKKHIFLKAQNGYVLERKAKEELASSLGVSKKIVLTENYFPYSLVDNTRGYIERIAKQAIGCYDNELYDACLVMTRRLIETLIIELFEKKGIENKIKKTDKVIIYTYLTWLLILLLKLRGQLVEMHNKD